mgnify:CR=1 FL=1
MNLVSFFVNEIHRIRSDLDNAEQDLPVMVQTQAANGHTLSNFCEVNQEEIVALVQKSKSTSCDLDPISTTLVKSNLDILSASITQMVNMSLQGGYFLDAWKEALAIPHLKNLGLDLTFKNFRPVSNLAFVSKIAEKVVIS